MIRISDTLLPVEESTKFLWSWWESHLFFKEHISALKTQCKEASEWFHTWSGEGQRHTTDAVPDHCSLLGRLWVNVYGTASNNNLRQLDRSHNNGTGHFAPAQSPVCARRPTKLHWRNVGWNCPWITIWKLVPVLTTQHIMRYLNLTQLHEICIFLGQMEMEGWPELRHNPLVSMYRKLWSLQRLTRKCSASRYTWIRSQETQPHWRDEQMYDHKRRGSDQISRVLRWSRTTWWSLHWRI